MGNEKMAETIPNKPQLTDDDVEMLFLAYSVHCGGAGDEACDGCPLYSEANDVTCAAYLMDVCRHPELYEVRDGLVEPVFGGKSSDEECFPTPPEITPQMKRQAAIRGIFERPEKWRYPVHHIGDGDCVQRVCFDAKGEECGTETVSGIEAKAELYEGLYHGVKPVFQDGKAVGLEDETGRVEFWLCDECTYAEWLAAS